MNERFVIVQQLATRKAADAFLADDVQNGYQVRLRRLKSDLPATHLQGGLDYLKVLKRQYDQIDSPSLLGIDDFGSDEDGLWVSVPIDNYKSLLKHHTQPMTVAGFRLMAEQLLDALAQAHEANIVHGAISPNVLEVILGGPVPTYRFMNLGYRKLHQMIQNSAITNNLPAEAAITAPELFNLWEEADPASDVYMLGQVFYMMLMGWHPWAELVGDEALRAHMGHELQPLHKQNKAIPAALSDWIDHMTQPDSLKRPKDARAALECMPPAEITTAVTTSAGGGAVGAASATPEVKGLIKPGGESKTSGKKKRISPAVWYSVIGGVGLLLAVCIIIVVKGMASSEGQLVVDSGTPGGGNENPSSNGGAAGQGSTGGGSGDGATSGNENGGSSASGLAQYGVKELTDKHAVLTPLAFGTVSGGDFYVSKLLRVGTNKTGSNYYGMGKTPGANASDKGNTWRSVLTFTNEGVVKAAGKAFPNKKSLGKVDVELVVKLDPKNAKAQVPLMANVGVFVRSSGSSDFSKIAISREGPDVRGVYDRGSGKVVFRLKDVDLHHRGLKCFGARIRADRKMKPDEYVSFDGSDVELRIFHRGTWESGGANEVTVATPSTGGGKPISSGLLRGDATDTETPHGRYTGPISVEVSSKGGKLDFERFVDGGNMDKDVAYLETGKEKGAWVILDLQESRHLERMVVSNDPNRVELSRNLQVLGSNDKKEWKGLFKSEGYQSFQFFFHIREKYRYLKIISLGKEVDVLAFRNIAIFTKYKETYGAGIYAGKMTLERSSTYKGSALVNHTPFFLDGRYSGGRDCNLHTNIEKNPYFIVDLKEEKDVDSIAFFKRKGFYERGANLIVSVSSNGQTWEEVGKTDAKTNKMVKSSVDIKQKGRYIKVEQRLEKESSLNLRNITIFLKK